MTCACGATIAEDAAARGVTTCLMCVVRELRGAEVSDNHVKWEQTIYLAPGVSLYEMCPKPVFVADGHPAGQCLRRVNHEGKCDVYDGSEESV